MLSYTIGRFAPIMEDVTVAHLLNKKTLRKLAKFAQRYYLNKNGLFHGMRVVNRRASRKYVENFLRDSHLPYEIKRRIAVLSGLDTLANLARYTVETETEEEWCARCLRKICHCAE